jgi:alpha-beta hydrolase superfamily lysophospholipase
VPGWTQQTPLSWERLSRDLEHLASLPNPELVHHRISARLFFGIEQAGAAALADAPRLQAPVLLLHGGADSVTSMEATREFHERAGSADKMFALYPDARHETHNDLCRDQVLKDVAAWIEARI